MSLIILILLDVCLKPSHPFFSYTPSDFFLPFLSIPVFCFVFIFPYFNYPHFFPFISYMFFLYLPVLHMVVVSLSWTVLPQSNMELPHFTPPSHLPHTASNLLAGSMLTDNQSLSTPFPT